MNELHEQIVDRISSPQAFHFNNHLLIEKKNKNDSDDSPESPEGREK